MVSPRPYKNRGFNSFVFIISSRTKRQRSRALLDKLSDLFSFVSYSEAVDRILQNRIDKPYAALSFDDGYKSCVRAADVLDAYGISACFFICPFSIDITDPLTLNRFCQDRLGIGLTRFTSWDDVRNIRSREHEIGSHTYAHYRMSILDQNALEQEVRQSIVTLEKEVGAIKHFAWPFGRLSIFYPEQCRFCGKRGSIRLPRGSAGAMSQVNAVMKNFA